MPKSLRLWLKKVPRTIILGGSSFGLLPLFPPDVESVVSRS